MVRVFFPFLPVTTTLSSEPSRFESLATTVMPLKAGFSNGERISLGSWHEMSVRSLA